MDPYLEDERLWAEFHHQLVMSLCQILLPGLVDRYRARVFQRRYLDEESLPTGTERQEEYLAIRERADDRLVTLVDVVSPANKMTEVGRRAYLDKRQEGKAAAANLVEIDLVLQGRPTLEYSRDGLPDWDYAVTVTRARQPERYEIYTATLQKRLPRFRLPLASDDRDTILDLHTAFTRCYDQGNFASKIDYSGEPSVQLTEDDRRWLNEFLDERFPLRSEPTEPPQEQIAVAAYYIWLREGRPQGRDAEHWRMALEQLQREAEARRSESR
jgi:hypothetical protein